MKQGITLNILVSLVGLLALVAAGVGLFYDDGGSAFAFTTLRGQTVQIYGHGLYRYDMAFRAPISRGTDAVTLFLALPMLALALVRAQQGGVKARLFLAAMLSYFLYLFASIAVGVAYNNLILVYAFGLTASLYAFILTCATVDLRALAAQVRPGMPRRRIAAFMFVAGAALLVAWLPEVVAGLVRNEAPALLGSNTTEVTYALDLGIITPTVLLTGVLVLRRAPLGTLLAPILLILNALVGAMVIGQTVAQTLDGITLTMGEYIGKMGSFAVMGMFAVWLSVLFFRHLAEAKST